MRNPALNTMNQADIGWVAGIIDGEGTICARPKSNGSRYVEVSMTTQESIVRLGEITGMGHVRGPYPQVGKKAIWIWHVADSRELARLYLAIYPMLTIEDKRQRIKESLDAISGVVEKWKDRPCMGCEIVITPTSVRQGFCSVSCRAKFYSTQKAKPLNHFSCFLCGIESSVVGEANKTFCSQNCGSKYRRRLKAKPILCLSCGSEYEKNNNTQKYCTIECRESFYKMREAPRVLSNDS